MTDRADSAAVTVQQLLARAFEGNDSMLSAVVAEFDEADWQVRHGEANSAAWILGHLAWARREAARLVGCDVPKRSGSSPTARAAAVKRQAA